MAKKKEESLKRTRRMCLFMNLACAFSMGILLLLFFCDFFRLSLDGVISNKISGFKMAGLLFGDNTTDILVFYPDRVRFASIMSLLSLLAITASVCIFIVRAILRKPVFSKFVFYTVLSVMVLLVVQVIACSGLTSVVSSEQFPTCATCIAESRSFISLILFIVLLGAVYGLNELLSKKYWGEAGK